MSEQTTRPDSQEPGADGKLPYRRPQVVMREKVEVIAAACNSGIGTAKESTDQGCAATNLMS